MKTLIEYYLESEDVCHFCSGKLGRIEYYPHEGGWNVESFRRKQWLYRTCLKCGYQWALWKIGVKRNDK